MILNIDNGLFAIDSDNGRVGLNTFTLPVTVVIGSNDGILIPVGNVEQRPEGHSGIIRYNSELSQYEGYFADEWISLAGNATIVLPGGSNTYIQFNDENDFGGLPSFTFDKITNTVFISNSISLGSNVSLDVVRLSLGNSTANLFANSNLIKLANSTSIANLDSSKLVIGTSTINSTSLSLGANVLLNTTTYFVGNSTQNVVVNSAGGFVNGIPFGVSGAPPPPAGGDTQVQFNDGGSTINATVGFTFNKTTNNMFIGNSALVGANVILDRTHLFVGNSTANLLVNSIIIQISNTTSVANLTPSSLQLAANTLLDTTKLSVGNSTQNTVVNSTGFFVNGISSGLPMGANTYVQFYDSGEIFGGTAGFTFSKDTNNVFIGNSTLIGANVVLDRTHLFVGNSTANLNSNSILVTVANSTGSANLTPTQLVIGTSVVNSTMVSVGANVVANTTAIVVGNSTAIFVANSTVIVVANSTGQSNLTPTSLQIAANVLLNSVKLSIGNSTVNSIANSTLISLANPSGSSNLTPTSLQIANTLLNGFTLEIGKNSSVDSSIEIGLGATGNHYALIDLCGDATYPDFGLRLLRGNSGPNTGSQLIHRGTGSLLISAADAGVITLNVAGIEILRAAAGNIGIGTENPQSPLHVQGASGSTVGLARFVMSDYVDGSVGSGLLVKTGANSGNTYIELAALSAGLSAWNNLILQSGAGYVGIKTTNPLTYLQIGLIDSGPATYHGHVAIFSGGVNAAVNGLEFQSDVTSSGYGWRLATVFDGVSAYDLNFQGRTNSATWSTKVTIQAAGNLFISNGSLYIGNAITTGLYGDGSNIALRTYASSAKIYFQNASGTSTFGIWDSTLLHVLNNTLTLGLIDSGASTHLNIIAPAANEAAISWYSAGTEKWVLYRPVSSNNLRFYNPTIGDVMSLQQTNGYVGIGTISPLARLHLNSRPGGEPTYRGDIILDQSNNIEAGIGGIEFKADAAGSGYGYRILSVFDGSSAYDLRIQSRTNSATWTTKLNFSASGTLKLNDYTTSGTLGNKSDGTIISGGFVTPQMYGCVGDGSTDDTTNLSTCLNSGKPVLLVGQFRMTSTITVSLNTAGKGLGITGGGKSMSQILLDAANIKILVNISNCDSPWGTNTQTVTLRDFSIIPKNTSTAAAIEMVGQTAGVGSSEPTCYIANFHVVPDTTSHYTTYGIKFTDMRNVTVASCTFAGLYGGYTGSGIYWGGGTGSAPVDFHIHDCQLTHWGKGVELAPNTGGTTTGANDWQGIYLTRCTFLACDYGVHATTIDNFGALLLIESNHFNFRTTGIYAVNIGYTKFNNNDFLYFDGSGTVYGVYNTITNSISQYGILEGNSFNGTSSTATTIYAIFMSQNAGAGRTFVHSNNAANCNGGFSIPASDFHNSVTDSSV